MKKIWILVTIYLILATSFSSYSIAKNENTKDFESESIPECHLIDGVPYVGQYDNFHCAYATKTMMINYFQKNTTLEEIIYLMGNAYSSYISKNSRNRVPLSGITLTQTPQDSKFAAQLFGLSYDSSYKGNGFTVKQEYWEEYWYEIKENISQNIPVEVCVSPFHLPSVQKIYGLNEFIWSKIRGGHAIVIVGYNESNQTICYNDPLALLYGNKSQGTYDWVSIETYKRAVETVTGIKYEILRFKNETTQKTKSEIIQKAYQRNIEKLKGNNSAYGSYFIDTTKNCYLGINATEKLNDYYKKGYKNRIRTIINYKINGRLGLKYRTVELMQKTMPNLLDNIPYSYNTFLQNTFNIIAIEKEMTAEYLETQSHRSVIYTNHSKLLKQEAQNWLKIADLYSNFQRKGIFLSTLKAVKTINELKQTMQQIIEIEKQMISDYEPFLLN